jgi:hypothetical protein
MKRCWILVPFDGLRHRKGRVVDNLSSAASIGENEPLQTPSFHIAPLSSAEQTGPLSLKIAAHFLK